MEPPQQQLKFVAGVGASAGGLESLERFFRAVPVDSGVAYIVVQHLSADHKSLMEELLRRFTRVPVSDARHDEEIVPNHIYLLPPGKELELRGNRLSISDRDSERALSFPIDRLLTSLGRARELKRSDTSSSSVNERLLIADQFNNRVIEVDTAGDIPWHFGNGPGDLTASSIVG